MLCKLFSRVVCSPIAGRCTGHVLFVTLLMLSILPSCALTSKQENSAGVEKARTEVDRQDLRPKLGDVKTVDGVEYIYGKNVRWPTMPGQPEYIWIRKDQYSSGLFDSLNEALSNQAEDKKGIEELERRLDPLEEEVLRVDENPGDQEKR